MRLQADFSSWKIDVLFAIAVFAVLVSAALGWQMRRDRAKTPKRVLTRFERISLTLQNRGDIARLIQAVSAFVFIAAVVFVRGSHVDWLLVCLGINWAIIPLHSLVLLLGSRKGLKTVPRSAPDGSRPAVERPPEDTP